VNLVVEGIDLSVPGVAAELKSRLDAGDVETMPVIQSKRPEARKEQPLFSKCRLGAFIFQKFHSSLLLRMGMVGLV
jgi:hypothetical protein